MSVASELLRKSLITEPSSVECFYVNAECLNRWQKLHVYQDRRIVLESSEFKYTEKQLGNYTMKNNVSNNAEDTDKVYAKMWSQSYLYSIGSSGVIHSVKRGRNDKFIMCNIRNMNTCTAQHEDYFNDSTIYINIKEKEFSVRCNRKPCNKKAWIWHRMN